MGYTGRITSYRNAELSTTDKMEALGEFRQVLEKYGITPATAATVEFHRKNAQELEDQSYEGPLVLDYRLIENILKDNYYLVLFSDLVMRLHEYQEVKGTVRQIADAIEGVVRDFPLGLAYYQSSYRTLSWLYFRKIIIDEYR